MTNTLSMFIEWGVSSQLEKDELNFKEETIFKSEILRIN